MIAIVKYNAGNIGSVTNALKRLGVESTVTDDPEVLKNAEKVIFPGVGEAGTAMKYLQERGLDLLIKELKQPVLGICLGMQLLCNHSEEGDTDCLGIFNTAVKLFRPSSDSQSSEKVPHMGWNNLGVIRNRSHLSSQHLVSGMNFPPQGDQGGSTSKEVPHYQTSDAVIYPELKALARENRKKMTDCERILWSQLKNMQRNTLFSKQHVIHSYIVDFVSLELKLIIEVDGPIHDFQKEKDATRDQVLSDLGFEILHFSNEEIKSDLNTSLNLIDRVIKKRIESKMSSSERSVVESMDSGINSWNETSSSEPPAPPEGESEGFMKANQIKIARQRKSKLLRKITGKADVYYVHSYYAEICDSTIAACDYILPFSSVLQKDNFYATQFHPEKSADVGEQILKNFIEL